MMKTNVLFIALVIMLINQLHAQDASFKSSAHAKELPPLHSGTKFRSLKSNERNARQKGDILTPIFEDFQVDEGAVHYPTSSNSPDVIFNGYEFEIVWCNVYDGQGDIYGKIYGEYGRELITDFKINDNVDSSSQYDPVIEMVGSNTIVIWTDERNGDKDIFGQYYLYDQTRENFQINENSDESVQAFPCVGANYSTGFVVAWQDSSSGHWDIYAQYFDRDGNKIGNNFLVNDDAMISDQMLPDIELDYKGNVVIVWQDNRNGNRDIYGQRFDRNMMKLGHNFIINDDTTKAAQGTPSVSLDSRGNFMVVWQDDRNGANDIYGQFFLSDGSPVKTNFRINDVSITENQTPVLEIADYWFPVILWQGNNNGITNIYGQALSDSFTKQSDNFRVTDNRTSSCITGRPKLSCDVGDRGHELIVVWQLQQGENANIWCQRYTNSMIKNGDPFIVNAQPSAPHVTAPLIGVDGYGQFTIVWEDKYSLFGQSFLSDATKWGGVFLVSWKKSEADIFDFDFALSMGRNFVAVWTDYSYFDCNDYVRYRFFREGLMSRNNQLLKFQRGYYPQFYPAVATDSSGHCVIVYSEGEGYGCHIYGMYSERPNPYSMIYFKIGDGIWPENLDVAMNNNGRFIVAWQDIHYDGDQDRDIYFRLFDSSRSPISDKLKANDNLDNSGQINPAVGIDDLGNFILVWEDSRNGDADIYYQCYDATGNKAGTNQKVNDDSCSSSQSNPRIGVDSNGYFVIVWQDNRNDQDIYGQLFGNSGQPIGSNYKVTSDTGNFDQYSPDVCFVNNRIYYTWVDHRQGRHIFARVDEFQSTRVDFTDAPIPGQYMLYQNYPNPFNPTTTISYALPQASHVRVQIFNLNGREVKRLVDEMCGPGIHSVVWDGEDKAQQKVSSGIYLCRFGAGEMVFNRKLILIK